MMIRGQEIELPRTESMSRAEYDAIRMISVLDQLLKTAVPEALKERCLTIPWGWRDMRLIRAKVDKLVSALYDTMPAKKIKQLARECDDAMVEIKPKHQIPGHADDLVYMRTGDYIELIDALVRQECWCCERDPRAQKKCRIRKVILDTMAYMPKNGMTREDGACELQGRTTVYVDDDDEGGGGD